MEYKYYLSLLNDKDKNLYNFIYNQITEFATSFEVDSNVQSTHRVIKAMMLDNPEIFWFEGKWKAESVGQNLRVLPRYKYGCAVKENILGHIKRQVQKLDFCDTISGVDQIKCVYDWLLENVRYCDSNNDQTIEGVFVDGSAVCKGIAKAFQFFMNALDIPSFLIEGTIDNQVSHMWNIVYVDDQFYHVDVTMGYQRFDRLFADHTRNKHYPCFMVSDKTISLTHSVYMAPSIRCTQDINLDEYLIESFSIPSKFKALGELKYLDRGSTCTVFSINGDGDKYALKVIHSNRDNNNIQKHIRELEILKNLSDCECVVKLIDYEIDQEKNALYLLMPFYKTLAVKRREKNINTLKEVINIGIQVLKALIECRNRGIYHLDVQPKNIYFDDCGRALLGDFGEARCEAEMDSVGKMHGTLAFMAPEVYQSGIYGQVSEIYSLGIVLYSLLNGAKLPFSNSKDLQNAINKRLSGADLHPCTDSAPLWSVIKRMCAFDRTERYSSYEDPLWEFERILNDM